MPSRLRPFVPAIVFVLIVISAYAILRSQREGLVDFVVPHTAAVRFLNHEPLYRPDDGHYQYKYFPAFAVAMVPFTWLPYRVSELTWFTLTVAMAWALLKISIYALSDRRLSVRVLFWVTLLLNGKFLVKEVGFGQFNLPFALLLVGAVIAAQRGRGQMAGALVAVAVFVKPYALILVPWLALTIGWRAVVPFGLVMAGGLLLPVPFYGWQGNMTLLSEWLRTVTDTTAPNLMGPENMSFASMWAKWIGPTYTAARLALASVVVAVAGGLAIMLRRSRVAEPNYLEVAYFLVLIPLVSPQGWDYVLIIALPAYVLLLDRLRDLSLPWRVVAFTGVIFTSFTVWDVMRRTLYALSMQWAAVSVGAVLIALCLMRLRWKAIA